MTFSWSFKTKFACEFSKYPKDQQDKILDFTEKFSLHGLGDFNNFDGKISPSWNGTNLDSEMNYAKSNHLWHYHIGIPEYKNLHGKYKTSDWVLHFQWINKGNHIDIVDICYHYKADGTFYMPSTDYLV